ncbi:MAG: hypothetical protein ACE5JU_21235 [Candidatus Binatia bacterium]
MAKKKTESKREDSLSKEMKRVRNLLVLLALKSGATSDEVDYATGMGAANIRAMFPVKRGRRKKKKPNSSG